MPAMAPGVDSTRARVKPKRSRPSTRTMVLGVTGARIRALEFTPPAGGEDCVLVLDAAAKGYAEPGKRPNG